MTLTKLKELDNLRRGVIPGLDTPIKKNAKGEDIESPEARAQIVDYQRLCKAKVGEEIDVPAAASEWLKRYGYFGTPDKQAKGKAKQ